MIRLCNGLALCFNFNEGPFLWRSKVKMKGRVQDLSFILVQSNGTWHCQVQQKSPMKHNPSTFLKKHRAFISNGVQNGWTFKMVTH